MPTTTAQGSLPVPSAEHPAFPFDAEVTITSVFDKGDGNRSFDAKSDGGKTIKVWRPDEGDFSHLSLIQKGDTVKVIVLGHARKSGEWRSHLLSRDKQPNGFQTELRRREQGQQGKLTHVEAEISPADHACLQYAHKLEKRVRPSLTQAEYVRELLVASLNPVRALWLSQQEGKR